MFLGVDMGKVMCQLLRGLVFFWRSFWSPFGKFVGSRFESRVGESFCRLLFVFDVPSSLGSHSFEDACITQ